MINLTHNYNIKTFDDVTRLVELEEDCLLADKSIGQDYITESNKVGSSGTRWKKWKGKGLKPKKGGNKTVEISISVESAQESKAGT